MSPEWITWLKANARPYHIHISNRYHKEFLDKLDAMGNDFIDWGFGSGFFSIALANRGNKVQGLDIEQELLEWAQQTAKTEFMSRKGSLSFTCDIDDLKPADIVFSDGLFEHYPDDEIVGILKTQIGYAKKFVVINLPTSDYPWKHNAFGNERWLSIGQWEQVLKPFKKDLVDLYRYGSGYFLWGVIRCQDQKKIKKEKSSETN